MPYLPVDLDAKRKAALIDRALGLSAGHVVNGLLEAWETVWRARDMGAGRDRLSALQLAGCFGMDSRIPPVLVEAGFLERIEGTWRVRGAAKWLYAMEGKSRGGHAAKGNLIPGAAHLVKKGTQKPKKSTKGAKPEAGEPEKEAKNTGNDVSADEPQEPTPSASMGSAEGVAQGVAQHQPIGSPSALTANIQQPTSLLPTEEELGQAFLVQVPKARKNGERADQVFAYWKQKLGKLASAQFTDKRRGAVEGRLTEGWSVEDLCRAVDGCLLTPWNKGDNPEGKVYDDLELICRSSEKVEQFLAPKSGAAGPNGAARRRVDVTRGMVRAQDVDKSSFAKPGIVNDF